MGLPEIILRAHRSQVSRHGVEVIYRSQTAGEIELRALRKQSFARQYETDGQFTLLVNEDWHVEAGLLVDGDGRRVTPQAGDAVLFVNAQGLVSWFEVLPWANDPAARFADTMRQIYEIHSKQTREFFAGQLVAEDGSPLVAENGAFFISEAVAA
ncbi:MAG: hypothetical protein QM775_16680 [Pirellulales bacterium]